jgi:hypothetical protein
LAQLPMSAEVASVHVTAGGRAPDCEAGAANVCLVTLAIQSVCLSLAERRAAFERGPLWLHVCWLASCLDAPSRVELQGHSLWGKLRARNVEEDLAVSESCHHAASKQRCNPRYPPTIHTNYPLSASPSVYLLTVLLQSDRTTATWPRLTSSRLRRITALSVESSCCRHPLVLEAWQ